MFDVCVIGHVTRDVVTIKGQTAREMPGGTAYYAAVALRRLGLRTAVVTRMAAEDRSPLLDGLRDEGVDARCAESGATMVFENAYPTGNPDTRQQRVRAVADPFQPADLTGLAVEIYHLGPLTAGDVSVAFMAHVAGLGGRLSLDVQGFLRRVDAGRVCPADWPEKREGLACVDILKADAGEAEVLTGKADPEDAARALAGLGPREVIITHGRLGALIHADGRIVRIAPVRAARVVDPTGCGDSFMAGYLQQRLKSADVARAGRFAAAVAALKLGRFGPFAGRPADVEALLRAQT